MKKLFLVVGIILALAPAARADISDSGNGVIGGTVTVQGNAFSVGGSTFVVNSGSITLGGPLNAASVGIKWADGTISTTATGGAGGAYLANSQTFTGVNVFISSVGIGTASPATALDVNSAAQFGSGATKSTF
jgi:hypothetical protein